MRMNPDNFLYAIKQLVVGSNKGPSSTGSQPADGGYNQDFAIGLGAVTPATGSTTLTLDGSNVQSLKTIISQTAIGTVSFVVPRDYDQNTDKLLLRVTAASAGATDTPVIAVASSTLTPTSTGSTYGALTAGTIASTAALSSAIRIYELDLSNQSLVRDTIVSLKLTCGAHATDAVNIYSLELVYASCLVAFTDEFVTGGVAVGFDFRGNPIR
jgi:hypothetical protein